MEFEVFTINDKIAGSAVRHGRASSDDLDGLAAYVLTHFPPGADNGVDAIVFADPDGALTFIDTKDKQVALQNRYAMTDDHIYTASRAATGLTWEARRRPMDGHEAVLSTFHSQENAVAYAEKDARGGSEGGVT